MQSDYELRLILSFTSHPPQKNNVRRHHPRTVAPHGLLSVQSRYFFSILESSDISYPEGA